MRKIFRGLSWKLTLSYTTVTVAALLVVEILFIAGIGSLLIHLNILPSVLIYAVETFIAPQVVTYLDRPEPDIESMTKWLEAALAEGLTFQSSQNPRILFELGDLEPGTRLVILDHNLNRLTNIPELVESGSESLFGRAGELLAAAQNGETDPDSISQIADGLLTTAVPVRNDDGKVLGIIVMEMPYPPRGSLIQVLSFIGVSLILFTSAAGIVGTVFGYFTARGLTRRLRTVSRAASSWSRGEFSAFIQDRSGDEVSQLAQQLNRMAEQLQNLFQTKQELAALEERNRLARDLHDSVKQQVFATTMQVGTARALLDQDPEAAREHLQEAERLARQAQSELAGIIHELHPATLKEKGLVQTLKQYVDQWSRLNHIAAEATIRGEGVLPLKVEQELFRVAQEALSNIARHSEATKVEIHLDWEMDEVSLTLCDNGRGFDVLAAEGQGVGLRSMRERMEALGGSLSVESTAGEGTRLTARLQIIQGMTS